MTDSQIRFRLVDKEDLVTSSLLSVVRGGVSIAHRSAQVDVRAPAAAVLPCTARTGPNDFERSTTSSRTCGEEFSDSCERDPELGSGSRSPFIVRG